MEMQATSRARRTAAALACALIAAGGVAAEADATKVVAEAPAMAMGSLYQTAAYLARYQNRTLTLKGVDNAVGRVSDQPTVTTDALPVRTTLKQLFGAGETPTAALDVADDDELGGVLAHLEKHRERGRVSHRLGASVLFIAP